MSLFSGFRAGFGALWRETRPWLVYWLKCLFAAGHWLFVKARGGWRRAAPRLAALRHRVVTVLLIVGALVARWWRSLGVLSLIRCPAPEQLRALLDGTLPPRDQADLNRHLEVCPVCPKELEKLVAGGDSWEGVARQLREGGERGGAALHQAMEDLKEEEPVGVGTASEYVGHEAPLSFLSPSDQPGHLGKLKHYEILEVIGRGGMGIVLKALDPELSRLVAIKVLAPQLATAATARARFLREAKAAAAVLHDHVVPLYAVDEANGLPFLVMQYVPGVSLQEKIDRSGPLELKEILRIGAQAASGLAAAHRQGIVHRDVKPANILLEDGVQRVRLTDFGLARAADDTSLTRSGYIGGSPLFMAPEQARGEPLDHRADLFSLGTVLYCMCTGRPPFRAPTTLAVLRRVSEDRPRSIREINPEIPDWLEAVVAKLHAKSPADRYQSADEVAELLHQHLARLQHPHWVPPAPPAPAASPLRSQVTALSSLTICPQCGCHLHVPDRFVGAQVDCPRCRKPFRVEDGPEEVHSASRVLPQRRRWTRPWGTRLSVALWCAGVFGFVALALTLVHESREAERRHRRALERERQQAATTVAWAGAPGAAPVSQAAAALAWFPADACLVGAMRLDTFAPLTPDADAAKLVSLVLPEEIRKVVANDLVREARVNQVAFAHCADRNNPAHERYFLRLTGHFPQHRLADVLLGTWPGAKLTTQRSPKGEEIQILSFPRSPVAVAVVADTNVLVAGVGDAAGDDERPLEAIREALSIRAGREPSVAAAKSSLQRALRELRGDLCGYLVGEIPKGWEANLVGRLKLPFTPNLVDLHLQGNAKRLTVGLDLSATEAADNKKIQDTATRWRRRGFELLENPPAHVRLRPQTAPALLPALQKASLKPQPRATLPALWQPYGNQPNRPAVYNWTQSFGPDELNALWDLLRQLRE